MRHCFFRPLLLAANLLLLAGLIAPGTAQAQTTGPTEPAEMAAFFDEMILTEMREKHIPGTAVIVVKDGQILFSRGVGFADADQQVPVNPAATLFRIGSVTKLFTWTAVMQLAEQGKLNLDADVNTYLDFDIPATYPEPITMRHLMSHTAGFEDRSYQLWATGADTLQANGDWLRTHLPARIRPAGSEAAYSNYGASLAGYIVERVSGLGYDDYLDQHILQPLAMTHSSSRQPLPDALAANMANGYQFADGRFTPQPFEFLNIAPAGAISATAEDMAHFMLAHLGNSRYANAQILSETTTRQMHSQLFTHDERIGGLAYGFFELERGQQRILAHGGDTLFFHSQLALLPDENVGFFAVCNSAECAGFPQTLFDAFMHHYYPETVETVQAANGDSHAALVAGLYRSNRTAETTAEKVLQLVSTRQFAALANGSLEVGGDRFVETEPFVFREENGGGTLVFAQDEQGRVTHAFVGGQPGAFVPVTGLRHPTGQFALLGVSVLLFLSLVMGRPLLALVRRNTPVQPPAASAAQWVLWGAAALSLLFIALVVVAVLGGQSALLTGQIPLLGVCPVLFGLIVALAAAALIFTGLVWRDGEWGVYGRIHFTLVTLAVWAFIWFVNYWRLLHW